MSNRVKLFFVCLIHRTPFALRTVNFVLGLLSPLKYLFKKYKNMNSLLAEINSEYGLQVPLLIEQNRRLFRELEQMKADVELLKNQVRDRVQP